MPFSLKTGDSCENTELYLLYIFYELFSPLVCITAGLSATPCPPQLRHGRWPMLLQCAAAGSLAPTEARL